MISLVQSILAYALVMGILVFVHELGHFLAARWRGVEVQVFSIGFGRALTSWRDRAGTVWQISAIPLGGYVRMLGQSDLAVDDAPAGRVQFGDPRASRSFADKGLGSRAIIVAAGPAFNFLFAILLFTAVYATAGRPLERAVVVGVLPNSAAAAAGFAPSDVILSVAGTPVRQTENVPALVARHAGERIAVVVERAGHDVTLEATPASVLRDGKRVGQLGINVGAGVSGAKRLSVPQAVIAGAGDTWLLATRVLAVIWQIVSGQGGAANLHGAIVIAKVSGQAAAAGIGTLVTFIAMVSVNLGLVNLLPVPILDGGHLFFYGIEAVLGRPLSRRVQMVGIQAGFALIAGLMLFTTVNDLTHLGLFRWMHALAG